MKASEAMRKLEEDVAVCPDCYHPLKKVESDNGVVLICSNMMCMNQEEYAEEVENELER